MKNPLTQETIAAKRLHGVDHNWWSSAYSGFIISGRTPSEAKFIISGRTPSEVFRVHHQWSDARTTCCALFSLPVISGRTVAAALFSPSPSDDLQRFVISGRSPGWRAALFSPFLLDDLQRFVISGRTKWQHAALFSSFLSDKVLRPFLPSRCQCQDTCCCATFSLLVRWFAEVCHWWSDGSCCTLLFMRIVTDTLSNDVKSNGKSGRELTCQ
jgi:hypothetical protein